MDSCRALRTTVATVITATTVLAGVSATSADGADAGTVAEPDGKGRQPRGASSALHRARGTVSAKPRTGFRGPGQRNRAIAFRQVTDRGWDAREFRCLDRLWTRESNWDHRAGNPASGAYGIPQASPGGKMADAGDDWRANPATQIRWGLGYIESRYGSPCGAWEHFQVHHWY